MLRLLTTFALVTLLTACSEPVQLNRRNSTLAAWKGTKVIGAVGGSTAPQAVTADKSLNIYVLGTTEGLLGKEKIGGEDFFVRKYNSAGQEVWTVQGGSPDQYIHAAGVQVAEDGSVYVLGNTSGPFDGHALIGQQDYFLIKYSASGEKLWSRQVGKENVYINTLYLGMDTAGQVYVVTSANRQYFVEKFDENGTYLWIKEVPTGNFQTKVTSDAQGNFYFFYRANVSGKYQYFLEKYSSTMIKEWGVTSGATAFNTALYSVSVDNAGQVYVAGAAEGELETNTPGTATYFLAKYDSAGSLVWRRNNDTSTGYGISIKALRTGGLFVFGRAPSTNFQLERMDADGVELWRKEFSPNLNGSIVSLAVDESERIHALGTINEPKNNIRQAALTSIDSNGEVLRNLSIGFNSDNWSFGGFTTSDRFGNSYLAGWSEGNLDGLRTVGHEDVSLTKFDKSGEKVWTKHFGKEKEWWEAYGMTSDSEGNVFIWGMIWDYNSAYYFVQKVSVRGEEELIIREKIDSQFRDLKALALDASGNIYLLARNKAPLYGNDTFSENALTFKYDSSGKRLWNKQLGKLESTYVPASIAVDKLGNVFIAGYQSDSEGRNSFLAQYNSLGSLVWSKILVLEKQYNYGTAVAVDFEGNVFLAGTTEPTAGEVQIGYQDSFLAKFDASGTQLWLKKDGLKDAWTSVSAIVVDSRGRAFIAGEMQYKNLDTRTSGIGYHVTGYDAQGNTLWTYRHSPLWISSSLLVHGLSLDEKGENLFISGETEATLDGNNRIGAQDLFLSRVTLAGELQ